MDLEPNADEQQVIDAAAGFLARSLPLGRFREQAEGRFDADLRRRLAEQGWYGLGLDEAAGGFGMSLVDEVLVCREVGRALGPIAIIGISLAAKIGAAAGNLDVVAALVAGEASVAMAVKDPNLGHYRLFDWLDADYAVVFAAGEARLVSLAHIIVTELPCLDRSVTMGQAMLGDAAVIARTRSAAIERCGCLITAAMLVGIAEAVTGMITEYAKIRETFGKPIGAYQAVRHPCADMAVRAFAARAQLFLAAVAVRDDLADADLQVDAAKALANEAAVLNVDQNIQLHGGIATTDEHAAHLYMKRAQLLVRLFGGRAVLDRLVAAQIESE